MPECSGLPCGLLLWTPCLLTRKRVPCRAQAAARKEPMPDEGAMEDHKRIDYVLPFKRYPPGHDVFSGAHVRG